MEADGMHAIVVYESFWGNTAAVAHAITDGLGAGTRALTTDEATEDVTQGADLIVAGAPGIAFDLASDKRREGLAADQGAPRPADLAHRSMRSWLDGLASGHGK